MINNFGNNCNFPESFDDIFESRQIPLTPAQASTSIQKDATMQTEEKPNGADFEVDIRKYDDIDKILQKDNTGILERDLKERDESPLDTSFDRY